MAEKFRYRKKTVYVLVGLISLCLVVELLLMRENQKALQASIDIQRNAEQLKVNTLDIIRNVHLLDLGLRGYAIVQQPSMSSSIDSAVANKGRIFLRVQNALRQLNYPASEFDDLRGSVDAYFVYVNNLRKLIDEGRNDEFRKGFLEDRGYQVWYDHRSFYRNISAFSDRRASEAELEYAEAQSNIYGLQIAALLIVIPTLLYTAFFSNQTVRLAERLRDSEEARSNLLLEQNEKLERLVSDRTQEIQAQNEEIKAQNEEIVSHNDHLLFQQRQIEKQALQLAEKNEELERIREAVISKNVTLSSEVERQNISLSASNKELLEQNARLEEFAYVISHNLRAPIARLIGLTSILNPTDGEEVVKLFNMIQQSSKELDGIVKDLTAILSIQRLSPVHYTQIDLNAVIEKVKSILRDEIGETSATIQSSFAVTSIFSLSPYIESIFLNIVSNAIKYRHPDRPPKISITSRADDKSVVIVFEDNGIGLDLNKHGEHLFTLYKRFHFHVEGKGLGLFLVKTQVDALGGSINVKSEMERGTTFEISLMDVPTPNVQ